MKFGLKVYRHTIQRRKQCTVETVGATKSYPCSYIFDGFSPSSLNRIKFLWTACPSRYRNIHLVSPTTSRRRQILNWPTPGILSIVGDMFVRGRQGSSTYPEHSFATPQTLVVEEQNLSTPRCLTTVELPLMTNDAMYI